MGLLMSKRKYVLDRRGRPRRKHLQYVPIDGYAWWSGTSMATPFVAGQAAVLQGANPQLTLDEVGLLIGGTADSLDNRNPAFAVSWARDALTCSPERHIYSKMQTN
jgi:subtilisin family serine protease